MYEGVTLSYACYILLLVKEVVVAGLNGFFSSPRRKDSLSGQVKTFSSSLLAC